MKKLGIFVIALFLFLGVTGCSVKPVEEVTDAQKFASEYSVSKDNPFKYATFEEVKTLLTEGTGIIYFGFPECPWCQASIKVLTDALKSKNIKQVFYFNPKEMRENNTAEYQELLTILGDNLYEESDSTNKRLYVPDTYFVKDGKILGHNNDMCTMSGDVEEYMTSERKEELKKAYLQLIVKVYSDQCSSC